MRSTGMQMVIRTLATAWSAVPRQGEYAPMCARLSARSEYGACATCWKSVQRRRRVSLLAAAMNFEWYEYLVRVFRVIIPRRVKPRRHRQRMHWYTRTCILLPCLGPWPCLAIPGWCSNLAGDWKAADSSRLGSSIHGVCLTEFE